MSPVVLGDSGIARDGGRVIIYDGKPVRYNQDDKGSYGKTLHAFEIDVLTTVDYQEHEVNGGDLLKGGRGGWNREGMHQIDPHQLSDGTWLACVDGLSKHIIFGLQY